MKKSKFLFILLPLMGILVFILGNQYFNHQSEYVLNLKDKFDLYLYKYDDFEDELPVITLDYNNPTSVNIMSIDKSKALEDIDYLFSLLKYGYSGYEYFGGDIKFNSVKSDIINFVKNSTLDPIPIENFLDTIHSKLDFIQDSHFFMDKHNLCDYTYYYSSRKFEFHKDINGYYTYIDEEVFYLKEIDNNNPENYINPSLDEDGKIIYNLGILSDTEEVYIPINLLLESNESSKNIKVSLFEYKPIYEDYSNSYELYEIDNIPILDVNSLCRIDPEDKTLEEFINDSESFREKENIIIDLRNNTGGNLINVRKWFKGFTGLELKQDIIESGLYTNTSVTLSRNKFELKENEPDAVKFLCLDEISNFKNKKYFPGWSPIKYEEFQPIESKPNIIVLLDKTTSSAAEFFIYYLKKLDNVTLVGTNTKGCMLTGNPNLACLPNSKIHFYISHKLYIQPDFTNIEGLGFSPDLWVKPEQSLDRVIKYIQNK